MKILITTYYGLREALLLAAESLRFLGHDVIDYPLFKYYADINYKTDNYHADFVKFVKDNEVDVILWWYYNIPTDRFGEMSQGVRNIIFNWDEPHNWVICDNGGKAKFLDCAFVTCEETLKDYKSHGAKEAICLYPGFDEKTHYPIIESHDDDERYECDISICCTNLYDDLDTFPDQYIVRRELIDDIYINQQKYGYTFFIYGPPKFKEIYPRSYKGFVAYEDTNKVFNYSKINICTHVLCDKNGYLNERVFCILAAGGFLFVDNIKGIGDVLEIGKECIVMDRKNYIEQIVDILENYKDYIKIRRHGFLKSKKFTWNEWAQVIDRYLRSL